MADLTPERAYPVPEADGSDVFDTHTDMRALGMAIDADVDNVEDLANAAGVAAAAAQATAATKLPLNLAVLAVAANQVLGAGHHVVLVDASGAARTITLPDAAGNTGRVYHVKKTDASSNAVIIDGDGADTIDGAATHSITTQYESRTVVSDGANWHVI